MSADLQALLASPWWRWMPRMRGIDRSGRGFTVLDVHASGDILATLGEPGFSSVAMRAEAMRLCVPDVADPATLGCLLALAREAWADPTLHAVPGGSASNATRGIWWEARGARRKWYTGSFPTEADALIAAILAAPSPGVGRG